MKKTSRLKQRLDRLENHLHDENPDLVQAVDALRDMDDVAHRMGLLPDGESYANKVSWWPLISVLGTFSAGKSSFINSFLGEQIQKTGNQAVDDHFTVITYSRGAESQTLPGQALDSDPRFPFYRISEELHEVIPGEGEKIDHYLQMKVVPSEVLKGKILIDSPGFDADEQRKSVLEITDHIISLSDLVLVFFDGRHPEVGAMRDTLSHLVSPARDLKDSDKFLFILNQVDTSAREDNLEEVVAAWRSALSAHGLSTGNFYVHFNEELAVPVSDEKVWARYVNKRNNDYQQITKRIRNLDTHRTYRIVGKLKPLANDIENKAVPRLREAISEWRKNVWITDLMSFAVMALVTLLFMNAADKYLEKSDFLFWLMTLFVLGGLVIAHFSARSFFARSGASKLKEESYGDMDRAFLKNTAGWRSIFFSEPTGFNSRSSKILETIRDKSEAMIVALNTKMANPSGKGGRRSTTPAPRAVVNTPAQQTKTVTSTPNQPIETVVAPKPTTVPQVETVQNIPQKASAAAAVTAATLSQIPVRTPPTQDVRPATTDEVRTATLQTEPPIVKAAEKVVVEEIVEVREKPVTTSIPKVTIPEPTATPPKESVKTPTFNTDISLHNEKIDIIEVDEPAPKPVQNGRASSETEFKQATVKTVSNGAASTSIPVIKPEKPRTKIKKLPDILTHSPEKTEKTEKAITPAPKVASTPKLPLTKPLKHTSPDKVSSGSEKKTKIEDA